MVSQGDLGGVAPETVVQVKLPPHYPDLLGSFTDRGYLHHQSNMCVALAAVLLAAAEQVSQSKLQTFKVESKNELTLHALAMAFQGSDSGISGDVFEWAVLLGLNTGEPEMTQVIQDGLRLLGERVERPVAILTAAEAGRLQCFSPALPAGASLATGRPGRPPLIERILANSTSREWKSDLVIGEGTKWVSATLKSNARDMSKALQAAQNTPYPPRLGICLGRTTDYTRDAVTGVPVVRIGHNGYAASLTREVLLDVIQAFRSHLSVSSSLSQRDTSGIGLQLERWKNETVQYAVDTLYEVAGRRDHFRLTPVLPTGAFAEDAAGALIAMNTLRPGRFRTELSVLPLDRNPRPIAAVVDAFELID